MPVRLSIRSKWTLVLMAVAAVPLALAGQRGLEIQRDGLRMIEQELEAAVVDQTASQIELTFDELTWAAHHAGKLALDERLPAAARAALLREHVGRYEAMSALALYDNERNFIDAIVVRDREAPQPAPLAEDIAKAAASNDVVHRLHKLPNGKNALTLTTFEDERLYVVAWLDLVDLERRVQDLSLVRFRDPTRIDVLTRSEAGGYSLFDPARSVSTVELLTALPSGVDAFSQPFVRTAEFVDEHGVALSGTLRSVPRANLAVRVVRPTSEAYVALESSRIQLIIAVAVLVLAVLIIAAFLGRLITKPIESLVKLVRRYAQRDWTAESELSSGDEFETLGDALTSMAHDIQASEKELERRAQIEAALGRFLPNDLARQIASGERSIALGGERRQVAVVFADVANFTGFAESRPVEEVVKLLNELFAILSEVVFRHGGMVDKFMGDCVMALFGAGPVGGDDPERQAIAAAEDMMRFVEASAEAWRERWNFDIRLGIGVAAGEALVGNLGSTERIEFTAVGDIVNLASRLEGLARPGQVLASQPVVEKTQDDFEFVGLGKVPVRGKEHEVEIFALVTE